MRSALALLAFVVLGAGELMAQQQPTCDGPEHRQFDFWIGEWRVERADNGQLAGHNTITAKHGGCVLHEDYRTPAGYTGESFNIYDRARGVWHQSWVDNTGLLLQLDGGVVDGVMVLEGPGRDARGQEIINRISWNVIDGDSDRVRQHWEISSDGGHSWTTAFDGIYIRTSDGA